ncbi:MAG: peptidoglycan DD-metalloendopeptidase family protein [Hyphomicrobiales bacterium]|nr:peptidoglycan DD-metalloendopeptidase family protein [Hyphomicrobiales bacterium]
MRPTILNLCSGTVSRAAILLAAAAALGGCSSDVGRFSDPVYTGSTPNQRAILNGGESMPRNGAAYAAQPYGGDAAERQWRNVDTTGSIEPGTAPVARADLAPAPSGPYAETVAHPLADATRPAAQPVEQTRVAAAGGWTPAGGTWVTLRQGETLDTLSNRYGVPIAALRQTNGYAPGRAPGPGDRVLIPVYNRPTAAAPMPAPTPVAAAPVQPLRPVAPTQVSAPVQPPRPVATTRVSAPVRPLAPQAQPLPPQHMTTGSIPAAAAQPRQPIATPPASPTRVAVAPAEPPRPQGGVKLVGAYTVRKGDTLASIAKTYGVSEQALRERNAMRSSAISPGQQILLPAGTKLMLKTSQAPAAAPQPTAVAAAPAVKPQQVAAAAPKAEAHPAPVKDTSKIDQKAAETIAVAREPSPAEDDKSGAAGSFRWPVRGRIISEYGAKANGERNEGINLAVPEGTSVKAADAGEVIYSGNELKGYGNLVLVRHSNGYVTAYAHASELLVNRGDKVNRGQIIARAGATGSVSQPQLHFELRKGQKAIDPKPWLASN